MKPFFEIILLSTLLAFANYFLNAEVFPVQKISIVELDAIKSSILFVDARTSEEFAEKHIDGAVNLTPEKFNSQLESFLVRWSPNATVVIYCNPLNCNSSGEVYRRLTKDCGVENIWVLEGDWRQWKK